ncbi:hypothetical protein CIK04_26960 [Vibrio sp. 03_296]|nr:hypothetical protein CIK04_26960 [Vibrio sp. 03_296]
MAPKGAIFCLTLNAWLAYCVPTFTKVYYLCKSTLCLFLTSFFFDSGGANSFVKEKSKQQKTPTSGGFFIKEMSDD